MFVTFCFSPAKIQIILHSYNFFNTFLIPNSRFIKEYGLILLAGAFVAFTVSYILMHGWLEQYVKRTPLSWWVFAAILVATALLIALFVGSRVWRTARENPADVIKSE